MLDDAMPVDKSSRRYPFAWWSTSTLIVIAVLSLLFIKGTTPAPNQPFLNLSQSTAPSNNADQSKIIIKDPTNQPSGMMEKSPEAPVSNQPNKSSKLSEKSVIKSSSSRSGNAPTKTQSRNKINKTIPMAANDFKGQKNTTSDVQGIGIVSTVTQEFDPPSDHSSVVPVAYPSTYLRNGHVVDPLQSSAGLAFEAPEQVAPIVPTATAIKVKRQPAFIEPNLSVSMLAGQHGGVGLQGGAGINMNLSNRFSLTSSIGYLSYHPNETLLGGTRSMDANAEYNSILNFDPDYTGNEIYVNAESVNNTASYNTINHLVEKVIQWQISAGIKWKMNRRFFMEGGVAIGLGTKAFSSYPIAAPDLQANTTPTVRFENTLNDFNVIRSTTTSLYGGIGYKIGQHIDVFANWTHGLNPYLLNDSASSTADQSSADRTDFVRGLSLGLRYTL
jgi:hypothetical protein